MPMNGCELTFSESRMHRKMPVRFGERLAETKVCEGYGAAIRLYRNNPDLMNTIFVGMIVLIAAGTISGLIAYT